MKRLFDIVLSAAGLILFFPVGLVIAVMLRCSGEGEIFYPQIRVGQNGRHFGLLKFATMLKDSPNIGPGDITVKDDPRVLPLGGFLRKTKLNEVPQLINILKGDMSIVGPRPQTPKYFALFPEHVQREIITLRPGLTGAGSIVFRDEETLSARYEGDPDTVHRKYIAPLKGELEIWYKHNRSLWLDIKLFFLTAWVVCFPNGSLVEKCLPTPSDLSFRWEPANAVDGEGAV